MFISVCVLCLVEGQSRSNGHMLPFVKFLQDQSILALYSRLFAGLPAHAALVPFPLAVADKSSRGGELHHHHHDDTKLSSSPASSSSLSSLRDYTAASLRFHPYMYDSLARRHLHASTNHR